MKIIKFNNIPVPARIEMINAECGSILKAKDVDGSAIDHARFTIDQIYDAQNTFEAFHHKKFVQHALDLFEPQAVQIEEH